MSNEQTAGMLAMIENNWSCFDALLAEIDHANAWSRHHGDDWTFADVPYHMMYFDREL